MPEHFRRIRDQICVQRKSSDGLIVVHYGAEKERYPVCSDHIQKLAGISRQEALVIKFAGSQRKVSFMHNENLWFGCFQSSIRQKARLL